MSHQWNSNKSTQRHDAIKHIRFAINTVCSINSNEFLIIIVAFIITLGHPVKVTKTTQGHHPSKQLAS